MKIFMKIIFVILIFLFALITSTAQSFYNNILQKLSIGLYIGIDYPIIYTGERLPDNAKVESEPGFTAGVKSIFLLKKHISLSSTFGFSSKKSEIVFSYSNSFKTHYFIRQANFQIGQELVFKKLQKVHLPYIILGANLDLPIEGVYDDHDYLPIESSVALISGIGYDFKRIIPGLSAELKYLIGFNNINTQNELNTIYLNNFNFVLNYMF